MNSSRAAFGSTRAYPTFRAVTMGRPYRVTRSSAITAPRLVSQVGSL
jgi:hypothetical protein